LTRPELSLFRYWLAATNVAVAAVLALAALAPLLARLGLTESADAIYGSYLLTCHEWPFRSLFLFGSQPLYSAAELRAAGVESVYAFRGSPELGYKLAFCVRNLAIFSAILLGGLAFGWNGRRLKPLSFGGYCLLSLPMALDGLTQLVGLRESTWELRTLTGALFGVASVWLLYPRLQRAFGTSARRPLQAPAGA
jgi:uncharacterized membrane protein